MAKEGIRMGKLDGKVAVVTAATSGMALATAKLFVEEGAYVFITGRRQEKLDDAVKAVGRNVPEEVTNEVLIVGHHTRPI